MLDAVKDFFAPKRFGLVGYAFLIVHFLFGLAIIAVTSDLRKSEFEKFSCTVGKQSTTAHKTYVEKTCYASYEQTYNRPLPLYGFVLLSTGLIIFVSLIYSLGVRGHVERIDNTSERSPSQGFNVFYFYTFQLLIRSLFGILFTVLQHTVFFPRGFEFEFSCKLPTSDIDSQTEIGKLNNTSVACQNLTATEKQLWSIVVSVSNCSFVLITFGELIYLISRRFTILNCGSAECWENDHQFITNYLLRKRSQPDVPNSNIPSEDSSSSRKNAEECSASGSNRVGSNSTNNSISESDTLKDDMVESTQDKNTGTSNAVDGTIKDGMCRLDNITKDSTNNSIANSPIPNSKQNFNIADNTIPNDNTGGTDTSEDKTVYRSAQTNNLGDNTTDYCNFQKGINTLKQKVLGPSHVANICYAQNSKADLNDIYIELVINTERAPHEFPKEFHRHEIYDVYMSVPKSSIRLNEIKDLFYPNKDTKKKFPRTILVVGRPGIGKTVLTAKIIRDWANGIDKFYCGKIVFFYQFRWFNVIDVYRNLSLKTFIQYGTGLSKKEFEGIFEEILQTPQKAIFIFDGLDEFNGDLTTSLDHLCGTLNDPDLSISAMALFVKLAFGSLLPGATVVVTSRPTADNFYSKLNFDRSVEVLGFTSEKIEEYVSRFCDNIETRDLQSKIWNHIKSSSDLLNLCYIPVNCFFICDTLCRCLSHSENTSSAFPTTLTELYSEAVRHFAKNHDQKCDEASSEQILQKLEELAFEGMEKGKLVFDRIPFDEAIKKSCLVNSLSHPDFPTRTLYCFIHLTIQEYLTAKHVIKTKSPKEIEHFIATHIENSTWHLVLQFIAGLLGENVSLPGSNYHGCVVAFTKGLTLENEDFGKTVYLTSNTVHAMKCLREIDDENVVQEVCAKTDLNTVTTIGAQKWQNVLCVNEWAVVTLFCKHLKNVKHFELRCSIANDSCLMELANLLKQTCLEHLLLITDYYHYSPSAHKPLISALNDSKCALNHEHRNLKSLVISLGIFTRKDFLIDVCSLMPNCHMRHLRYLDLQSNNISVFLSELWRSIIHCPQLGGINLSYNPIGDDSVRDLCKAIQFCGRMEVVLLDKCSLTDKCVPYLSALGPHKLRSVTLSGNEISEEGLRTLRQYRWFRSKMFPEEIMMRICMTD